MFQADQYELIDFGGGRKLERFGRFVLDRPAPAAESFVCASPSAWRRADARYQRTTRAEGRWNPAGRPPRGWTIRHDRLCFELRATPFGHVGLFPEQADNWDWISEQVRRAGRSIDVLNLFAYTGGSTLAAAAAGARVVHVDAARNVVQWARDNARASGLEAAPIRWIAEDAVKFARRELRRGRTYQAVILDPPSYGHGPKSDVWKLEEHLASLLELCGQLTRDDRAFVLLTCHSPGHGPRVLRTLLQDQLPGPSGQVTAGPLAIKTADGRSLAGGVMARWSPLGESSSGLRNSG